jgi:uncharacterized protein YjbI with pentapeptide repeats
VGAYLVGANLEGAYLARANLVDANLVDANLVGADLEGAIRTTDPAQPYERKVRSDGERASDYRAAYPDVPVVDNLDARILSIIEAGAGTLDMGGWHSCETTHCRAGWAIHLAGDRGYALEKQHGPQRAGAMIYRASTGHVPHFFATTERALEDIRRRAAEVSGTGDGAELPAIPPDPGRGGSE